MAISTPFNRIKYSTKIRQTRDGQRDGLLRNGFIIWNVVLTNIQLYEDLKIS